MTPPWIISMVALGVLAAWAFSRPGVWGVTGGFLYAAGVVGRGMANESWRDPATRRSTWIEAFAALGMGAFAAEAFGPVLASALHGPTGSPQAVWGVLGLSSPKMYPVAERLIGARLRSIVEAVLGRTP